MKIKIMREDIENGKPRDCVLCPVALAIKRTTGQYVQVTKDKILMRDVSPEQKARWILLPEEVVDFIQKFDTTRKKLKPFSFELEID